MYEEILKNYNDDDYVYIIEGCMNQYASKYPASDKPCEICGDYDWPVIDGKVKDIKAAKSIKEFNKNKIKMKKR